MRQSCITEPKKFLKGDNQWEWKPSKLIRAANDGQESIVDELLKDNENINVQCNHGWTALMRSSLNGYKSITKRLLDHNASVNLQDDRGFTALMESCRQRNPEITKLLLRETPDLDLVCMSGRTALMNGIRWYSNYEILKLMLNAGSPLNTPDKDGLTPLLCAVRSHCFQSTTLILQHGSTAIFSNDQTKYSIDFAENNISFPDFFDWAEHQLIDRTVKSRVPTISLDRTLRLI